MKHISKVYQELERLSALSPLPFYWTDAKGTIIGVNKYCFDLANNLVNEELVGKSAYDIYTPESAAIVQEHINEVIATKKTIFFEEELIDLNTFKKRCYVSSRCPLFEDNQVIGIVGCITEITFQKESEKLKYENERLEKEKLKMEIEAKERLLQEQTNFRTLIGQMIHDLQSPLSSLRMLVQLMGNVSEEHRILLRDIANRIKHITNNLLYHYQSNANESQMLLIQDKQPLLLSTALNELLNEKKYEYKGVNVEFDTSFTDDVIFAFINIEPNEFKRMISNLINNAVEALKNKSGKIEIKLEYKDQDSINISVIDNGKGMSIELLNKLKNGIMVSEGKANGHGIGFTQIRETIKANDGKFEIYSNLNEGTTIIINFPKVQALNWLTEEIKINRGDTIVILDDDPSIHSAWDNRFKSVVEQIPGLKIVHFSYAKEAIDFINKLPITEKPNIFLLTDYELLNQNLNGLEVIEQTKIARSILVTNHHANSKIIESALYLKVKVLPKDLAFAVKIETRL